MCDKKRRKISIRARIIVFMLIYMAAVFFVVLVAFNLLVDEYIKNTINEQLKEYLYTAEYSREDIAVFNPGLLFQQEQILIMPSGIRRLPRGPVGKTEAIIVSENYELIFPNPENFMFFDLEEVSSLVRQLAEEQVDLSSKEISQIKVSGREFYLVSIPVQDILFNYTAYLVSYIDMTTITTFAGRINTVLIAVMGLAVVFALLAATFLSGVIARPIRELTRFAARIGRGDFTKNKESYQELELAELAESMNTAAGQLERYDREQKTFFQNVSHELRTPLQSIRCSAEGIEHAVLDQVKASRVIIAETGRLSDMVEDLLYLSRIDNISGNDIGSECDLREMISNCAGWQSGVAAEKNLRFVFDFDQEPVNFFCFEKHLSRAFTNLISNAIRYAAETITLSCHKSAAEIMIEVRDDGPGIAEEDLPHVFNRFYKGKGGKHGIGLAIVKTVIEQHKGRITVSSEESGSLFTIYFNARSGAFPDNRNSDTGQDLNV